jgi:hypothetical protein
MTTTSRDRGLYRVWITRYENWRPRGPRDRPPAAVALEPAEAGTMPRGQARAYADAFNTSALAGRRKLWAVVLPVEIRYEGDLEPGQLVGKSRPSRRGGGNQPSAK